jgi:glycosyltransferase involved in cell wall biosynthesis
MPDGLEAPAADRARSTFRSWFGGVNGSGASKAAARPFGANVAGYFTSEKGTGEAARSAAAVLRTAGVPIVLNTVVDASSANLESVTGISKDNPYAFNLVYVNADQADNFVWHKGEGYFSGRYSIGIWNWEVPEFPEEWVSRFDHFDEIWAGTTFAADALARVSPVPVTCMPYAIDPEPTVAEGLDVRRFGVQPGSFLFLFMFDFHSVMERKNPLGLIAAFKQAFGKSQAATLLIKSSRASADGILAMKEAAAGANVSIIDTVISREELNALYRACDCYVSLHRSEGFGLTIAEAMMASKPVIATGFSGNMDFMTARNSYLVRYSLTEIERDHPPYRMGWHWAEPDIDHAAELMRRVVENPSEVLDLTTRAREDILRLMHPDVVGQRMKARLMEISAARPTEGAPLQTAVGSTREDV